MNNVPTLTTPRHCGRTPHKHWRIDNVAKHDLLTISQAAKESGVSYRAIKNWIGRGWLSTLAGGRVVKGSALSQVMFARSTAPSTFPPEVRDKMRTYQRIYRRQYRAAGRGK